ncbi:MAG: UvrD-helicase domain-containing protein, partial [Anaerolineae bacterium]|nr:UvrD-helicase domain-containing protein [Anaerolineae bacterium]
MFTPRPRQRDVIAYTAGRMGVVAVPGSGKTRTLSALATRLVAETPLEDGQEILVVTLVNSAVGNFARQVGTFVSERGLIPGLGYRVRTLHGLANDIVRERPALAGLEDRFAILDERESQDILQDAAISWVRNHPNAYYEYAADNYQGDRESQNAWGDTVTSIAANFIKKAKDLRLMPDKLRDLLAAYRESLPLAEM